MRRILAGKEAVNQGLEAAYEETTKCFWVRRKGLGKKDMWRVQA